MFRLGRNMLFTPNGDSIDWRKEALACFNSLTTEQRQLEKRSGELLLEIEEKKRELDAVNQRLAVIKTCIDRVSDARSKLSDDDRKYGNFDITAPTSKDASDAIVNDYYAFQAEIAKCTPGIKR